MPIDPQEEQSSTYFVQDRSNVEEMNRLELQDKMLTTGMGGVLPELADPTPVRRVLDVGCGTGGWLIETAKTYPSIEKLVGADISGKMLAYARVRADAEALDQRVQFREMDALRMLEFADASFDLVNQRLGDSWLRTWDWKKILLEYQRVTRPGGIIRITEGNAFAESNSPALTKLCDTVLKAFYNSGRLFTESNDGIIRELPRIMTQYGISDVQSQVHTLTYQAGTESGQQFYQNVQYILRLLLPFFHKWTHVPVDYEDTRQQALKEIQQSGFVANFTLITCWGKKPMNGRNMHMRGLY
jgi:ubiquinone/menaquinone biosynthesis C-methylase UbiE